MKRAFAWFFACYFFVGGLYPNTDFAQLWHAASALQHFKLHESEAATSGTTCTLWTFIRDHYINPESHKHDGLGDHEKLPAKHLHHALDLIVHEVCCDDSICSIQSLQITIGFINQSYSFLFKPGIDRPPSLA
jgi:hypothetical protein